MGEAWPCRGAEASGLTGDENNAGQRSGPGCAREARAAGEGSSLAERTPSKRHRSYSEPLRLLRAGWPSRCPHCVVVLRVLATAGWETKHTAAGRPAMARKHCAEPKGFPTSPRRKREDATDSACSSIGRCVCGCVVVVVLQPASRQSPAQTFSTPPANRHTLGSPSARPSTCITMRQDARHEESLSACSGSSSCPLLRQAPPAPGPNTIGLASSSPSRARRYAAQSPCAHGDVAAFDTRSQIAQLIGVPVARSSLGCDAARY